MNTGFSWHHVLLTLQAGKIGERITIPKLLLPHPRNIQGFRKSLGLPFGQHADWRYQLPNGGCIHVHEYAGFYTAHLDRVDPAVSLVDHARYDCPTLFVAAMAALGCAMAGRRARREGAALGGLVALFLLPNHHERRLTR